MEGSVEQFRQAVGQHAMEAMDSVTEADIARVGKFYAECMSYARYLREKGTNESDSITKVAGLAASAAFDSI